MKLVAPLVIVETGTFTRASTGTYFDPFGVLQTAAANVRRISYEPEARLLLDAAATNLAPNSEDSEGGYWWNSAIVSAGHTAHGIKLNRIEDNSAASQLNRVSGATVANDTAVYTVSLFLKQYASDNLAHITVRFYNGDVPLATEINIDFAAMAAAVASGPCVALAFNQIAAGLFRLEATVANNGTGNTSLTAIIYPAFPAASAQASVYAGGLQIELGTRATSYIKTTAAAVTRAADINTSTLYSTVPEPSAGEVAWATATAYTPGQRVFLASTHKIYECLIANTNANPDINLTGADPKWLLVGPTNRWAMFDQVWGTQSGNDPYIQMVVCLSPGVAVDSLVLMNFSASSITVTMTVPGVGCVYARSTSPGYATDYAYTDMPLYANGAITVVINNNWGQAKCGKLVIGNSAEMGGTHYGATAGVTDYSAKSIDAFGNVTIVKRRYSKRMTAKLRVANTGVDRLFYYLVAYRSTPLVWIGADNLYGALIVYGYYRDFEVDVAYATESYCSLTIEGLT